MFARAYKVKFFVMLSANLLLLLLLLLHYSCQKSLAPKSSVKTSRDSQHQS